LALRLLKDRRADKMAGQTPAAMPPKEEAKKAASRLAKDAA
jgi:hypothetical protein